MGNDQAQAALMEARIADSNTGRENGKAFENLFMAQARRCGLLARKQGVPCRVGFNGRMQPLKGSLDFHLTNQDGHTGFFDCKSFKGARFGHSDLDEKQIETAILNNEWKIPSGFVVWLREINMVVFYSGLRIARIGPGASFGIEDGIPLGTAFDFNLKLLLDSGATVSPPLSAPASP